MGSAPLVHAWTGPTGVEFRQVRSAGGVYYHHNTPPAVVAALDRARAAGARVRLWYGDAETGLDWMDEYGVTGLVGSSTGPFRIPILLANSRSTGGAAILDACVIRLLVAGHEEYRHPRFMQPALTLGGSTVLIAGEPCRRFSSELAARRWLDFMHGKRMSK